MPIDEFLGEATPGSADQQWLPTERDARLDGGQASVHVLLVMRAAEQSALELRSQLDTNTRITVVEGDSLPTLTSVDVAVLGAGGIGLSCGPLLRDPALGFPELVFVVDELWSPQDLAIRSRGFRHIVSEADLPNWLPFNLAGLVSLARARRGSHARVRGRGHRSYSGDGTAVPAHDVARRRDDIPHRFHAHATG